MTSQTSSKPRTGSTLQTDRIKALAFDFGGTLDSPFQHWADVYLTVYNGVLHLPLDRRNFWDSYVHTEREMERLQPVKPTDDLLRTQSIKTHMQFADLCDRGILPDTEQNRTVLADRAAEAVTEYSEGYIRKSKAVLERLHGRYPMMLVSNYYGNMAALVAGCGMSGLFLSITDSTVVGIRKPDPRIWQLAFDRAGYAASDMLVVGDSTKNDILPALSLGCQVVKCLARGEERPDGLTCITDISQLAGLLL